MKKFLALVMACAMTLSLVACGAPAEPTSSTPATSGDASTPVATKDLMVGAIYITGQNDTAGYTFQHHRGITTAMEALGLDVATQLKIVDNVPEEDTQVSNAIDNLAGQGCDIIIGISFGYLNPMQAAAEKPEYSEIIFSHATGYLNNETNFNNYFGRIYQARYLSGVAAGLKTLETGNNSVGYVAAWNLEYAETASGINAFTMGVQAVNPEAIVYVNQISTWGDEARERQAAQALVDTANCGVIAQHCDSAQPQLVAAENNIFGIGYNSDMTEQAPTAHLTAPIWHWNEYYEMAFAAAMNAPETFMTEVGVYYGGLAENFIDISPLSENNHPAAQSAVDQVRALMTTGEWDVFSGTKLAITVSEAGEAVVAQVAAPLMTNDGVEIVAAGGPSVDDGVIKGSMNYNVEGVVIS